MVKKNAETFIILARLIICRIMVDTILVTGGAGFIGSHTCEKLLNEGFTVVAIDNFNDYYDVSQKEDNVSILITNPEFTLIKGDITDADTVNQVFLEQGVNRVIHLAARAGVRPSIEDPQLYGNVNLIGTINLLEAARKQKITQFIFGSSSSVYGENTNVPFNEEDTLRNLVSPYAVTKRAGELMCKCYHSLYDLDVVCLRFFTVYGPSGRPDMAPFMFTKKIMEGTPINKFGDGTTQRDYTFISDIVEGIIGSMKLKGFEIINLGNNNPVSLNEFIKTIEKMTGKQAIINQMPMQPGDVPITYADISKAKKLIGYEPKIKLEEGMKKFFDWFRPSS